MKSPKIQNVYPKFQTQKAGETNTGSWYSLVKQLLEKNNFSLVSSVVPMIPQECREVVNDTILLVRKYLVWEAHGQAVVDIGSCLSYSPMKEWATMMDITPK